MEAAAAQKGRVLLQLEAAVHIKAQLLRCCTPKLKLLRLKKLRLHH